MPGTYVGGYVSLSHRCASLFCQAPWQAGQRCIASLVGGKVASSETNERLTTMRAYSDDDDDVINALALVYLDKDKSYKATRHEVRAAMITVGGSLPYIEPVIDRLYACGKIQEAH